ncbi:MAG: DNA ligase [Candidatus Aenigmatarchaeota archaeon]|nr:MAG: DNA ligase [Candidatus Aenigmarchaeota archaeon]
MKYQKLADVYQNLENTPAKLEKVKIISRLMKEADDEELKMIALLIQGRVFPSFDDREIGIAAQSMEKIIVQATGFSSKDVGSMFRELGDYGLVAEKLIGKKKQQTLFNRPLTLEKVFDNLQKISGMEGRGSQDRKFRLVAELVSSAKPLEAKYIVRTTIGDLRIGVAEGIVRDAIADAFLDTETQEKKKESTSAVEWAWFLRPDYSEVALIAKRKGIDGLNNVKIQVGKPYHVLLAEKSPGLEEALSSFEKPALEYKYDGARVIIHKKGDKMWFYTRRLENVTRQFPELQDFVKEGVRARECIIEGEMIGFSKETGKPMPFQFLSQRIKRKYDIDRMAKEIPISVNVFDIVYLDGKDLFERPLSERWETLKTIIRPIKGKFQLAEHIETKDLEEADKFYRKALSASQEGLIVKNMDAKYHPGRRVAGGWLKVKPVMETLDLAIIGATWGTGKRAGWLGSYILGCRDEESGNFLNCGMIGTGIKEKKSEKVEEDSAGAVTFKELTDMLKSKITEEHGSEVKIKPDLVVEVAYEEIQKSPNYESGYALRFPRVLKIRPDKDVSEADTTGRIKELYSQQKGKRSG